MTRMLRAAEVVERVGYSKMQIWRLEKAGRFPQRVKLGPHRVAWVEEEIEEWLRGKAAERGL